jgi:PAS domain S-box-containing protein
MQVLVLDDVPAEAERMAAEVRRAGDVAECPIAHDRAGLSSHLEQAGRLDVVLCVLRMADGFGAFEALPLIRSRFPDAAFIVVAGAVTEELATGCARAGADDFVSREYLARLRFAIPAAVEKRRSAAAQRRAEAELLLKTHALEAAANAIVITDVDGRIEWVNPAFTELTGYTAAEALGQTPRLLRSDRHDAAFYEALWRTIKSGGVWRGTVVNRRKNGTAYHEEMTITPLHAQGGVITHFVAVKQDVTARREMEHSRDRLARIVEATSDVVGVSDAGQRVVYVNPAGRRMVGLEPDVDVTGWPIERFHPPWAIERLEREALPAVLAHGSWQGETALLHRDGREIPVSQQVVFQDVGGAEPLSFTVIRDLSEQRRSAARLASLVDAALDAIVTIDARLDVALFNPAAERMFGRAAGDVLGRSVEQLIPEPMRARYCAELRAFLSGRAEPSAITGLRFAGQRADGEVFPIEGSASRVSVDGDELLTVIARDVAERERLGEQLRQSQKLEAVGRLAGGIAHDFNNMLGVIIGYGELLQRRLSAGSQEAGRLEQMLAAAHRAAGLTRQLLAFSRKQVLQPRVVDPNALIADLQPMLSRLIGEDVELHLDAQARGRVNVDPGQFQQVLMNLVINARDALPGGGRISIATADVDGSGSGEGPPRPAGPCVALVVADTGHGMDLATQQRIFEPFFTTKPEGKGTGLGLPTVHGIVQQSGGAIRVESAPGAGTRFEILLPRVDAGSRAEPASTAARPASILLVVGESAARDWMAEVLRDDGHAVVDVADPSAAPDRPDAGFDLALIDLERGAAAARGIVDQVRARSPRVKIGLLGGLPSDRVPELADLTVLLVPFGPADLRAFVRARLAS